MFYLIAFIFGSIWGSFSNVCIHRIPDDISVVTGRSHCPSCKTQIKWHDNIPLFSYLFLKAKCRNCSTKIDIKYFLKKLNLFLIRGMKIIHCSSSVKGLNRK